MPEEHIDAGFNLLLVTNATSNARGTPAWLCLDECPHSKKIKAFGETLLSA